MLLINDNPVVIPAKEEEVYPHLWVNHISVTTNEVGQGRVTICIVPYNADTQKVNLDPNVSEVISTDKLWESFNEVPEMRAAMNAILTAVQPLKTWLSVVNNPPAPVEPQP